MARRSIIHDKSGASAAEFAMVLPLAILIMFGIIDGGRYLWEVNRASKATQAGARVAVVTDMIPAGLVSHSFSVSNGLPQGTVVGEDAFPGVTCTGASDGVDCEWLSAPSESFDLSPDNEAFTQIFSRMQQFMADLEPQDVMITYENSGLGFAGDPSGPDVAPLVTVSLSPSADFEPILSAVFDWTWGLPSVAYSMPQEDGQGVCFEEMGAAAEAADCRLD